VAKRGNSEGSICRRRDGRWVAVLTSPERPDHASESCYAKAKAAEELRQAQSQQDHGALVRDERQTAGQYLT
jgi:hypothetical protein